jgi:hypothetical protein
MKSHLHEGDVGCHAISSSGKPLLMVLDLKHACLIIASRSSLFWGAPPEVVDQRAVIWLDWATARPADPGTSCAVTPGARATSVRALRPLRPVNGEIPATGGAVSRWRLSGVVVCFTTSRALGISEGSGGCWRKWRRLGRQFGRRMGRQIGRQNGRQIGRQNGRQIGRQKGRQIGRQNGRQESRRLRRSRQ